MIFRAFDNLIARFFPAECPICLKSLQGGERELCLSCLPKLHEQALAPRNAWHPTRIRGIQTAWSAFHYQGPVREMFHRIKFEHEFYLLKPLCRAAIPFFNAILAESRYDMVIPMPLSWKERWSRRFNQTEIMADHLLSNASVPLAQAVLSKKRTARPQSSLRSEERHWNLFGAFDILSPKKVSGKSILLVDDIITTGATAAEAARTLIQHGASQIDLFTLARTEKNDF